MIALFSVLGLLAVVSSSPATLPLSPQRIVGGSVTTVSQYPYAASLLYSWNLVTYSQSCGGTLLTTRAVLSAAHCFYGDTISQWRVRLGSSFANSGGYVYSLSAIRIHRSFNANSLDNDVAVLISSTLITHITDVIQPASIANPNYNLADNQAVWAIGWGTTSGSGAASEQLRSVQIYSVNLATCRSRYVELGKIVTDNMLCSGYLDVGYGPCQGDGGGPLIHNNVIVGISSWGSQCSNPRYPAVNTRISTYTNWIVANS